MSNKRKLRELSVMVNNGLTTYISVHNKIHKEAETFWSSIKNLLGFGVPLIDLLSFAEKLIPLWSLIIKELNAFKLSSYSDLPGDEKKYFDTLLLFTEALQRTVHCLVDQQKIIVHGINEVGSMSWKSHQEKRTEYKNSIEDYLLIGQELNKLSATVFK